MLSTLIEIDLMSGFTNFSESLVPAVCASVNNAPRQIDVLVDDAVIRLGDSECFTKENVLIEEAFF